VDAVERGDGSVQATDHLPPGTCLQTGLANTSGQYIGPLLPAANHAQIDRRTLAALRRLIGSLGSELAISREPSWVPQNARLEVREIQSSEPRLRPLKLRQFAAVEFALFIAEGSSTER
jgi:hypothetical protein